MENTDDRHLRWQMAINVRALLWMTELRTAPQEHAEYRHVAAEMVRLACADEPALRPLFRFVDEDAHALGRLAQENRRAAVPAD